MEKTHIGNLIRIARKTAGLSQMKLADMIGVSYQQVQKYEKGLSEISISRLAQIAHALNTPLSRFIPDNEKLLRPDSERMVSESITPYGLLNDDEIELLRVFRKIKNKKLREGLFMAIKGIAGISEKSSAKKKSKK